MRDGSEADAKEYLMPKAMLVVMDGLGDRACARGAMGRLTGLQVMPEIINLLGLAKLIGD